jgi:hypothetical protein
MLDGVLLAFVILLSSRCCSLCCAPQGILARPRLGVRWTPHGLQPCQPVRHVALLRPGRARARIQMTSVLLPW